MDNRTIAAISTPIGPGGIGIIRLSGPDALIILKKVFLSNRKSLLAVQQNEPALLSHRLYYGQIQAIDAGEVIDEVLVFYMKGPNSYTREDVVEIQSHSGYVILERLLSTVLAAGAERAKPGEFTQRAFLNGRIDLTQAEAVIDLINAPCETAAMIAAKQVSGGIKNKIDQLFNMVTQLLGRCEASIEFEESDNLADLSTPMAEIKEGLFDNLLPQISRLIQSHKQNALFFDGVLLTIAGVPNVGKSSLLNKLVERETAIVSDIPGTTRDVVREYLSIEGIPVTLCDTAGLHESEDPIECIGIQKAHDQIDRAEIVLFVVDSSRPVGLFEDSFLSENSAKRIIAVINKIDIAENEQIAEIKRSLSKFENICVSAKTGDGIDQLKKRIFNRLMGDADMKSDVDAMPNLRQRHILEKIERLIISEQDREDVLASPELVAETLVNIRSLLEEISGSKPDKDIYEFIFSEFCVGK